MLGLVARQDKLVPCWNVGFGITGTHLQLLTAGFISHPGDQTGWSFRPSGTDAAILRVHVGSNSWAVNINLAENSLAGRTVPAGPILYGDVGIGHTTDRS